MTPTLEHLRAITGRSLTEGTTVCANAVSVIVGLQHGAASNLHRLAEPNQLAHYLAQLLHESNAFMYDQELWGPTDQQKKYEPPSSVAKSLGNVSRGDGFKYRGRTAFQVTGRSNYKQFFAWAATAIDEACPDFEENPDALLTDPWEGLAGVWFWGSHGCIPAADTGIVKNVTLCVNGGYNGLSSREDWFTKTALVFCGYKRTALKVFQEDHGLAADNIAGPNTWGVMTELLKAMPWQNALDQTPQPVATPVATPVETELSAWLMEGQRLHTQLGDWLAAYPKGTNS